MKTLRKPQYWENLQAIEDYIAHDNPLAASDLWLGIDEQVSLLADPNFPRRRGRAAGTLELVVHPDYVVILEQSPDAVTVLEVLHVAMKYP